MEVEQHNIFLYPYQTVINPPDFQDIFRIVYTDMASPLVLTNSQPLVSPESEVADLLRVLGDRVEEEFSLYLDQAVIELVELVPNGGLSYAALQSSAMRLLNIAPQSWTQVMNLSDDNAELALNVADLSLLVLRIFYFKLMYKLNDRWHW